MKKVVKILLALSLSTILAGCSIKFGVESRKSSNYAGKSINQIESIEGINNLNINIDVSNVDIRYYEGKDIEISGVLGNLSKGITVDRNSSELDINERSNRSVSIKKDTTSNLKINIPNSYNGNIKLTLGVGEYKVNDVKADNMKVETGVGKLSMSNISFNRLDLESGVGEVDIDTKEKTGEIIIDAGVGDINIKLGNINGNLTFDGGMGSTRISIPPDSPVNIKTSSGLGESNVTAKTSGENKYIFDVSMGIGELNITN
ncbi:hypothetical protein UT300007_06520 [Clostridium sp. CTA-7]